MFETEQKTWIGILVNVYKNALISILKPSSSPPLDMRSSFLLYTVPYCNMQVSKSFKFYKTENVGSRFPKPNNNDDLSV